MLVKYGGDDAKKLVPSGDYTVEMSCGQTKAKQSFHATIAQGIKARSSGGRTDIQRGLCKKLT